MGETIKLMDFISEAVKCFDLDDEALKPEVYTSYECSKCGRGYDDGDKFCSKDGAEIVEKKHEVRSDDAKSFIIHTLWMFEEENPISEKFPYEYVKYIETRGDGSGYFVNFIFKRKSDEKFFYYTSYDGRIENEVLRETKQEVKVVWDFERSFY